MLQSLGTSSRTSQLCIGRAQESDPSVSSSSQLCPPAFPHYISARRLFPSLPLLLKKTGLASVRGPSYKQASEEVVEFFLLLLKGRRLYRAQCDPSTGLVACSPCGFWKVPSPPKAALKQVTW